MSVENPNGHHVFETLSNVNREKLSAWFNNANLEIIPPKKTKLDLSMVPMSTEVSITSSPTTPLENAIEFLQDLIESGRPIMPHIAARHFKDSEQVAKIMRGLQNRGVDRIFLIAGDNDNPSGAFNGSMDLLNEIRKQEIFFKKINIAGYPEGHPKIANEDLDKNLLEKQTWAKETGTEMSIITQICFDSKKVVGWIERTRKLGITLPIIVGIPAKGISLDSLVRLAIKSGVGDSINIIKKDPNYVRRLIQAGLFRKKYDADDFLVNLSKITSEKHNVEGMHVFTYFKIASAMEWIEKSKNSL